jgi:hypothetical protein
MAGGEGLPVNDTAKSSKEMAPNTAFRRHMKRNPPALPQETAVRTSSRRELRD